MMFFFAGFPRRKVLIFGSNTTSLSSIIDIDRRGFKDPHSEHDK